MNILITGAGGFLGRGITIPFEEHGGYTLRLMDVVKFESKHEVVQGDVCDYAQVEKAMQGIEGLIINHMAPRGDKNANYQHPKMPFDINVTGTANLFHAAKAAGVKQVVVISSGAAVMDNPDHGVDPRTLPYRPKDYYGLTKACQEIIAETFARTAGMNVCCLRPGYILDGEKNLDKYGRPVGERNYQDTDRRDIGEVARLWLEKGKGFEPFVVLSTLESIGTAGVEYTCKRLGWMPKYDFSWLKSDRKLPLRVKE